MLERRSQPGAEARHATHIPKNGIEPPPKKRLGIKVIPYDGISGVLEFQRLNRAVESAKLKIPIAEAFPLAAAATAHQRLESKVHECRAAVEREAPQPYHEHAKFERSFGSRPARCRQAGPQSATAIFINQTVYDLLVRVEAAAKANGRVIIGPFDLPNTKGLQESIQ